MRVGIDPGHGGKDRANVGPTGYVEADGALDIALHCMNELVNHGFEVVMTRTKDVTLSIGQRANMLNAAEVDIAVSIHTNACDNPKVRGVETIHSVHHSGLGDELAAILFERLSNDLGIPRRRVMDKDNPKTPKLDDYYGIIRDTKMPCVIVEVEFHTNLDAEKLLKNADFRRRVGISIAQGIMDFRGRYG